MHVEVAALVADAPLRGRAAKPAASVLPDLVDRQWQSLGKRADALTADAPDEDWHRVRINAKRTRYAAELAAVALGQDATAFARRMKRVTELLGDLQDSALLRSELGRLVADGSPVLRPLVDDVDARSMFVLGRVHAAEERSAELLRDAFPALWADVRASRHRRWMRLRP
jgi:CHAD domain-containing protein